MDTLKGFWRSKTIYRKLMLVLAAIQFLGYFFIPIGEPYRSLKSIRGLLGLGGVDLPEKMTQFGVYRLCVQVGGSDAPFYLLAMVFMAGVLAVHIFGKRRLSYAGALGMEGIAAFFQSFIYMMTNQIGYETIGTGYLLLTLDFAIAAVCVLGLLLEMRGQARLSASAVTGGTGNAFSGGKLSEGMETAGAVASYLAKKGGKKLKEMAGSARDMVDEAKNSQDGVRGGGAQKASSGTASGNGGSAAAQRPVSQNPAAFHGGAPVSRGTIPQNGSMTGIQGAFAGAQIPISAGEKLLLGRSAEACNLILEGPMVSRKHCTVEYDGASGSYFVTDHSENGTFTGNGGRLPSGKRMALPPGTVLWIGGKDIAFQLG